MDWIKLIVGLIVVVAWIASNLRQKPQPPARPGPPPLPPVDPKAAAAPRQSDDLQEFLKQVRRRMGNPEPAKIETPPTAVAVEAPPPLPKPPAPKPKKKTPQAPTMERRAAEVTSLVPDAGKLKPAIASDPAPMVSALKRSSVATQEVVNLLRSPGGPAKAFLLKEILDKPLSKQPRR